MAAGITPRRSIGGMEHTSLSGSPSAPPQGRAFTDHLAEDSRDHWPTPTEAAPIRGHALHPYDAPRLCVTCRHTDRAGAAGSVKNPDSLGAFSSFRTGPSLLAKLLTWLRH